MARGGSKKGERRGGRQKGTRNKKVREIADKALEEGITPLEVMLKVMRSLYAKQEYVQAAAIAKDAAPYVHPRLQAMELSGKNGGPVQTEDQGVKDLVQSAKEVAFLLAAGAAKLNQSNQT